VTGADGSDCDMQLSKGAYKVKKKYVFSVEHASQRVVGITCFQRYTLTIANGLLIPGMRLTDSYSNTVTFSLILAVRLLVPVRL